MFNVYAGILDFIDVLEHILVFKSLEKYLRKG